MLGRRGLEQISQREKGYLGKDDSGRQGHKADGCMEVVAGKARSRGDG